MPYVGETGESAWIRHDKRLHHVFAKEPGRAADGRAKYARADDELDEYERQLRRCGAEAARHERFVMVLEQVPRREGEGEGEWTARRKRVEKFWVATLHTAFNKRGWNVEHAPATLQRLPGGRPTRRAVRGQERAQCRQRKQNRSLKRRAGDESCRSASATARDAASETGCSGTRGRRERRFHRGPRVGRAERSTRRRGAERAPQQQRRADQGSRRRTEGSSGGRRFDVLPQPRVVGCSRYLGY